MNNLGLVNVGSRRADTQDAGLPIRVGIALTQRS